MANKVTLTFAGDADSLAKASKESEQALGGVGSAADATGKQLSDASKKSADLGAKVGHLGSAVSGAADAFDAIGGSLSAVVDLQRAGAERASRLQRALLDVEQAQEDYNQALRDSRQAAIDSGQAAIDLEQANLDASTALKDYNKAVKEHGKNSDEARQAAIDLKQAGQDVAQAQEDQAQFTRDAAQATIDAKGAQMDLNDANREAHPPELAKYADELGMISPLLSAVVGVVGLVTAAQWLWNASLLANPLTWIVIGIIALVAVIVLIATKTTWFQDLWHAAWGGIKAAASDVWDFMKKIPDWTEAAFGKVAHVITAPYRFAFNLIADAWNHTIGSLHWSVPSWIPGIGGNQISVPNIPKFHSGGVVPGAPGSELLAVLQAGETVVPAGGAGGGAALQVRFVGNTDSAFATAFMAMVRAGYIQLAVA
jgi:hypothetical protein